MCCGAADAAHIASVRIPCSAVWSPLQRCCSQYHCICFGFEQILNSNVRAGGLVQVEHFSVLPDVGPVAAAAGVLVSMVPLLASVWKRPDPARFARCVALASLNRCILLAYPCISGKVSLLLSRPHNMSLQTLLITHILGPQNLSPLLSRCPARSTKPCCLAIC